MRPRTTPISSTGAPALVFLLALAAAAGAQTVDLDGFEVETVIDGLNEPRAFDFIGADELFVFERGGEVQWVRDGKVERTVLRLDVHTNGTRGGLGLAVDPDFADNGLVYLFYSAADNSGAWIGNRLARAVFNGNRLLKPETLIDFPRDDAQANDSRQNGGTLRFGPDGRLYGSVGSLGRGEEGPARVEQNVDGTLRSGVGGIFRLATDGTVPADNPFVGAGDDLDRWYVYGFRDGLGLGFDPVSGELWFSEIGPGIFDEINYATAGTNSGWLRVAGPDKRDATYPANGDQAYDKGDLVRLRGSSYRDPLFSWAESIGVSGLAFLDTDAYGKQLRDQLVVGDDDGNLYLFPLKGGNKRKRLKLSGSVRDRVADSDGERALALFGEQFGAIHDLRIGPDGHLWASDRAGGRLLRIVPRSEPVDSTATYVVTFDAEWSATTHPDDRFPDNPHFSGLIGGTHNAAVTFWGAGAVASDGIENMSETGSKSPLDDEVRAAIAAGAAQYLLSGGTIASSPGSVALEFDISVEYPLVTLVTMLAPSPDWFAGVSGLNLIDNGEWADRVTVDLFAYDAGSDSGVSFNSANADTNPAEPIARITGSPFLVNGTVPRIGTFTFRRQQ